VHFRIVIIDTVPESKCQKKVSPIIEFDAMPGVFCIAVGVRGGAHRLNSPLAGAF